MSKSGASREFASAAIRRPKFRASRKLLAEMLSLVRSGEK
jgi:hypothetical protein